MLIEIVQEQYPAFFIDGRRGTFACLYVQY